MTIENLANFEQLCTGCFSCANICSKNAIQKKYREDGFFYPSIDSSLCVNCSACLNVCPINLEKRHNAILKIYSAAAKDVKIRNKGSSGAIFPLLSDEIIKEGGVVYGAVFSREKIVYHTSTDNTELAKMLRSKYVQSDVGFVYRNVEKNLLNSQRVFFSGTPCQIRGLKTYLEKKRINTDLLLTMDFMCHGVPSPKYFEELLTRLEKEENATIQDVTFREKSCGWRKQRLNIYFTNGGKRQYLSLNTPSYYYFLNNYNLRKSCYTCEEFSTHVSDITVADHWTVDKSRDDDTGISLVFIHSKKGVEYVQSVLKQCDFEEISQNSFNEKMYSHEKYSTKNREKWITAYSKKGEEYVSRSLFKKEKRKNSIRKSLNRYLSYIKKIIKMVVKR